ncbi:MAG: carboxyl transferase domain-containing protein [Myxococcota bacterium]
MARLTLRPLGTPLEGLLSPDDASARRDHMQALDQALQEKITTVKAGWGEKYVDRVHEKGKLTTAERLEALLDEDSPWLSLNTLVNWGRTFEGSKRQAPGAGVWTGLGRVEGRWVVVVANDNTVASGAWWPLTPEKIERAQQVAERLRLPVVYLVDCSGLFLPEQSRSFSGLTGAGHIFTKNARLAAAGVPQLAGVFGDCIAGGGYMPIISDRVVMTEQAYMVIAGAALIKGAKSQHLTSLDIGGPEVHVHQSGCADVRVPDDPTALRLLREEVAKLPGSAVDFYRHGATPEPPAHPPHELSALFPSDPRETYSIEEVLARLVDGSLFHEVLAHTGREMITGVARIDGLWVGLIANRQGIIEEPGRGRRAGGVLYREGIAKISTFARACNEDGIPLVWLQDISGFDIGVQAEQYGLLGYGSNLIYANSTVSVPVFTVLLRKASGAGYYAMSGLPYEPVLQLATPLSRLAVMEGRTLAIAAFNSKLDDDFEIKTTDPAERAEIEAGMAQTAARIEADMDPVRAASTMDTDEIVPLANLRDWLVALVQSAWQSMGYRRTKNPRIWSLHDLAVLAPPLPTEASPRAEATVDDDGALRSPAVGTFTPTVGGLVQPGQVFGHLQRAGGTVALVAPPNATGVPTDVVPAGQWVEYGAPLLRLAAGAEGIAFTTGPAEVASDAPEGTTVVRAETDGAFYARAEPSKPPFVSEGDSVAINTTLGLVEVMKTFTPVKSPVAGRVVKVVASDGAAVSQGDALVWIEPAD